MKTVNLGDRIQLLRKQMGYSQKSFAEFLNVPQPSISAYENGKNSPTIDVLINIATKCNVSIDWLCGLDNNVGKIKSMAGMVDALCYFLQINEIKAEIEINDKLYNDTETNNNRWYTKFTFYGNDKDHEHNSTFCNIVRSVTDYINDLENYAISKDIFDIQIEKTKEYYSSSFLTYKEFPDLPSEERIKKYKEYLNTIDTE